ncbi:hypothetical protein BDZ97DRAFT_2074978 [Flammula alnicola]|nr:hypothetical protein BDZ97DRAFT_2074978 [Flammula alnicola]
MMPLREKARTTRKEKRGKERMDKRKQDEGDEDEIDVGGGLSWKMDKTLLSRLATATHVPSGSSVIAETRGRVEDMQSSISLSSADTTSLQGGEDTAASTSIITLITHHFTLACIRSSTHWASTTSRPKLTLSPTINAPNTITTAVPFWRTFWSSSAHGHAADDESLNDGLSLISGASSSSHANAIAATAGSNADDNIDDIYADSAVVPASHPALKSKTIHPQVLASLTLNPAHPNTSLAPCPALSRMAY